VDSNANKKPEPLLTLDVVAGSQEAECRLKYDTKSPAKG